MNQKQREQIEELAELIAMEIASEEDERIVPLPSGVSGITDERSYSETIVT